MARYPNANDTAQWFQTRYPGSAINPNVVVWHTTETGDWPGYSGGATAPTLTVKADMKKRRLLWRQHFDTRRSARALRNEAGGVETNTLNCIQVELVGTCDESAARRHGWLYWPEAPSWMLDQLADFMVWLNKEHTGFPLEDAAKRGWKSYKSGAIGGSYGKNNGVRLSFSEWRAAYGNLGHQHVPENSHGDPGNIDMDYMCRIAKAKKTGDTGQRTISIFIRPGDTLRTIAERYYQEPFYKWTWIRDANDRIPSWYRADWRISWRFRQHAIFVPKADKNI